MSDRITRYEIYHETRNHLLLVLPLIQRLGAGSASPRGRGLRGVRRCRTRTLHRPRVAYRRACGLLRQVRAPTYLYGVAGDAPPSLDTKMLDEVQAALAITACALSGMQKDASCTPEGVNPPWVATQLWYRLRDLHERIGDPPSLEDHAFNDRAAQASPEVSNA